MNADAVTQPSMPMSTPEAHVACPTSQTITYPIFISHDTLNNRLAALKEFSEDLPNDQLPVCVAFVERPL